MSNIYAGKDNVARTIKNVYVGVNGVAKLVNNAYVGVNGLAKLSLVSGNLVEFVRVKSDGTYDYVTTNNNGNTITPLHTLSYAKEQNCHIWNRNNTLYRMLIVITSNNTVINYLQKKEFGATSWTTLKASSEGIDTYALTYNQQEDIFMFTKTYNGIGGELKVKGGSTRVYCCETPVAGNSLETTDFTTISYSTTEIGDTLQAQEYYTCRPIMYKSSFVMMGYNRWLRDSDQGRGVRFTYKGLVGSTAWYIDYNGMGISEPISFKDAVFCSPEVFDFDLVTTPCKLVIPSGSRPTLTSMSSLGGSPYSFHTDFVYGNARGRFFLKGSELVYVVPVKYDTGGDVAVINIYTSTDGVNFTMKSSTPLPSVGSSAKVSTYFGETKDKWNFAISSDFNGSTHTNVVFYSIDKNTLALEYNSPVSMEGRIYCQGHTKYE